MEVSERTHHGSKHRTSVSIFHQCSEYSFGSGSLRLTPTE